MKETRNYGTMALVISVNLQKNRFSGFYLYQQNKANKFYAHTFARIDDENTCTKYRRKIINLA